MASTVQDYERAQSLVHSLLDEVHRVLVGQESILQNLIAALLGQGHCLLIGVPGLAKTLLVKSLAQACDWEFRRIQFTPDLMPSDIIGSEILETEPSTGERRFRFMPGPVFSHILLADEINRTPPKTQSALLEAMQELAVTVNGRTMQLERPYFVVATQNPIEQEGTYPLPEAQLDRFMFSLQLDYPGREHEEQIVAVTTSSEENAIQPVLSRTDLIAMQDLVRAMPASEYVVSYAVRVARASRPTDPTAAASVRKYVEWGAGPRASQFLIIGAKARALMMGRSAPSSSDVRSVAHQVLSHRIIPNYAAAAEGVTTGTLINEILQRVKETVEPS